MFFRPGPAPDPLYCQNRDLDDKYSVRGREYLERIWREVGVYVDDGAAEKATRDFLSVFWELQLAHNLKGVGKQLVPRSCRRSKKDEGPDLLVEDCPKVWVEAVVVRPGTGPDALQFPEKGKVFTYDSDGTVLRIRSVFREKSRKIENYIAKGIIQPGEATVIAVSGVDLPYRWCGAFPPAIVKAVYPANNLVLEFDRQTKAMTGSHVEYRDQVKKKLGEQVATDVFLDPVFSHVSAVLFAEHDWVNPPDPPGIAFVLVHNSMAVTPLPDGWLAAGDEYWWREGGQLERRQHDEERAQA